MLLNSVVVLITACALVAFFIKKIIYISNEKHLFDEPAELRKIHKIRTPNLGGIAIVVSMALTACIFFPIHSIRNLNYIFLSFFILFIIGLTDDLVGVKPVKKLIVQLVAALIITVLTGWRFTSFYGVFGYYDIPVTLSIFASTLFITFIINAFNLIDGINCLAASIALLICVAFTFYFYKMNETNFMYFSIAMCGCLASFLWYNKTPSKIFMGDTGSLFIGFIIALLSIHFLELNKLHFLKTGDLFFNAAPNIILGLLIIPVYDTLRVFIIRILNKKSPFIADRNHIHHRLIDFHLTHLQATGILIFLNLLFMLLVFLFRGYKPEIFLLTAFLLIVSINQILSLFYKKKINKPVNIENNFSKTKFKIIMD